jgi:serine protease inhibitor
MRKLLIFLAFCAAVGGCKTPMCGCVQPFEAQPLRVSATFTGQTNEFALDVFKRINEAGAGGDVFFSPLSLHMALGMVLNGANGQTRTEMQQVLRLSDVTLPEANNTYRQLLAGLPAIDRRNDLRVANSVWYRSGFAVAPAFTGTLRESFGAQAMGLDFSSPSALAAINGWASNNTNGLIPKVLDELKPEEVLMLLNAVYFKGNWTKQFDAARTIDAPFTLASGSKKQVRMMRMETDLRRTFRENYVAFELPYGSGETVMTVLLPNANTTADRLLAALTPTEWAQLQSTMATSKLDIGLPKFSLRTEANLKSILSQMGMPTAFTDRADFTGINAQGGLLLTQVKQNAFVTVDEKGTEAAAVTNIGVGVTSVPVPYLCDRPFLVVIHEKTSGTLLFLGKIANPSLG